MIWGRLAAVLALVALLMAVGWEANSLLAENTAQRAKIATLGKQVQEYRDQQKAIHVQQERRDAQTLAVQANRNRVAKATAGLAADLDRWLRNPGTLSANRTDPGPAPQPEPADAGAQPRQPDSLAAIAEACVDAARDADIAIDERNRLIELYPARKP